MSLFNDTKIAFKTKSNAELKKAYWLFKSVQLPALSKIGTRIVTLGIENNVPFMDTLVKKTMFEHFCGGTSRNASVPVVEELYSNHIGSIFDYAKEGEDTERGFDDTCEEIKFNIAFARGRDEIPFVVFKPTGFGRIDLYEEVGRGAELTSSEKKEWADVKRRYEEVCELADEYNVRLMVDAEETWMQDAADSLVREMQEKYNRNKVLVWNTVQMYRTGRLEWLENELKIAKEKGYKLGYKFVRGAYMEKERQRAEEFGYTSPIQPTKQATDDNYNRGIQFVMDHLDWVSGYFGTHNEKSTELILDKMKEKGISNSDKRVFFGQLYGMSDNITFWLGSHLYNATKYLPYGSVKDVIPYLMRRAQENTSVAGQTGRELSLIQAEMKRRGIKPI